jgi:hemerythrin-like domain-containing protein
MKVSEDLRNEHEGVLLSLKILEKICVDRLPIQHVEQLLEFFRIFVDKCHHGKEEDLLFPALEAVGVAKEGGPIGVMLAEHQMGRDFVKEIARALDKVKSGDINETNKVIENATNYIKLLRQHIDKENTVLFVMADSKIPETKQAEMLKGFEEIEEKRVGHGKHEEFHKMLHSLRDEYLK